MPNLKHQPCQVFRKTCSHYNSDKLPSHRRRLEKRLLPLVFNNGRCDVGSCEPEVRNIGLDSCVRVSSRRDCPGRASGLGDFFQCDWSAGVNFGRFSS